jgi:hypothetical protein
LAARSAFIRQSVEAAARGKSSDVGRRLLSGHDLPSTASAKAGV